MELDLKKGGIALGIVTLFVTVILVLNISSTGYSVASDAGDDLNASNLCSQAACFYNASRATASCTANNLTPEDTIPCASSSGREGFPLGTLLGTGGVIFILVAALLIRKIMGKSK